jgi:hypothetical protein
VEGETKDRLSILNICRGAVPELFDREVAELMDNINDCNTDVGKKRKIVLEFDFEPFKDRSGATVTVQCKSKLAAVEAVEGNIFFARDAKNNVNAYPHDPRQVAMFAETQTTTPKQ